VGDTHGNISEPAAVAVDEAGNVFIADFGNNRVRMLNRAGLLTTVAGAERGGFSGDDSAASSAELRRPSDMTMDASGNLFIADQGNHRIRKVDPAGIITTVAGSGSVGSEGGFSGDGGPATAALLKYPAGIAVDAQGNLFIADTQNHRIRKVDPAGIITTVAGVGTPGFSGDGQDATSAQLRYPQDVAVDGAGNLFIADAANASIRKVTPSGVIGTIAGIGSQARDFAGGDGGPAIFAQLRYPTSVAVDAEGNVFFAEFYLGRIRKVTPGGIITTVVLDTELGNPWGVSVDGAGNLLIADSGNNRIRKMTHDGIITTVAGVGTPGFSGDFGPAAAAQLDWPTSVVSGLDGNLFIADSVNHRIRKVSTLMGPVLLLDSTQYRVGDAWSLKVDFAALNTSVHLLGTSNGQAWEIPIWLTTDGSGSFKVEGTFAGGTEGSHTLQVEIGGVLSNPIAFRVSNQ
jgi:sugar lactone lactonase YvrE